MSLARCPSESDADETILCILCSKATLSRCHQHTAGIWGKSDVVKTLLEAGADVNARATGEHSLSMMPLHWMVYPGYTEAVKLMIAAGSDVNAIVFRENGERVTALDIAELYTNDENPSKNHIATAALLVEAGAMHAVEVDAVIND
eukprot:SAG31_NODE_579_length_13948_cov_5.599105_8_plen_146_part_00